MANQRSFKYFKKTFLILLLLFLIAPLIAKADLGPKPSMDFNFIFKISPPVNVIDGQQIVCQDKECHSSQVLMDSGPAGFRCQNNHCHSIAYGYNGEYNKLILRFSDKTRESNIFKNEAFSSIYDVTVDSDKLTVIGRTPFFQKNDIAGFIRSFFLTLIVELIAGLIFLINSRLPKRILTAIFLGNCVTLPLIWFVMPKLFGFLYQDFSIIATIISEAIVIIIETFVIFLIFKKHINWRAALKLSLTINIISWLVGGAIEFVMGFLTV